MLAFWTPEGRPGIESFDLTRQEWTEFSGYWVGVDKDNPPGPDDLVRPDIHLGNSALLSDGNQWMIPLVEFLPHRHGVNHSNGEHVRRIHRDYKSYATEIDRLAEEILPQVNGIEKLVESGTDVDPLRVEVTISEAWLFCVQALSMNYRLSEAVIDVLDLVGDGEMLRIILTAMELDQHIGEVVKKKKREKVGASVVSLT
jgi:hypothetical protein